RGADQPQPSMSLSGSAQSFSQSRSNLIPTSQLEEELARSLAQTLCMEQSTIDVEKPFGEMGLDSVVGVEWIHSLNKQYTINLKAARIYDYPTIRQLAGFLQKEMSHQSAPRSPIADIPSLRSELTSPSLLLQAKESVASSVPALGQKDAIAIIGMSGKYPDARNLTDFWDNLLQGKNAVREIPSSRFNVSDYSDAHASTSRKISCKWLGALDEVEYFDPLFFHLSPAEAELMDPQHRLFLEEGYKAFEDAGYSPGLLSNRKCGVYLGIVSHEYALLLSESKALEADLLGTSSAIAAARIAYHLNLKGPAIAIDTACSSSLVAMHLACQALRSREIDMALVGGVTLYLTPDSYVGMSSAGMLSADGQCKAFDASANGFVPAEGVGALVFKRLAEAEADHDQIYGVIIGSGTNQDGATNGITAPSARSQTALVREIYDKYDIDPESISYVEMHATGTKLGDPIELEALATVFQQRTQRKQFCAIGSVKTNIGHTMAAAGVTSVHKVLLQMRQKKLVPSLHFEQPNPHFDFAASPFYVNTSVQDWQRASGTPLRAAVSAFGFSGTNAHLILEEYLPSRQGVDSVASATRTANLFVLSAKSEDQLKSSARQMRRWIQAHGEQALPDIALTLQVGRLAMEHRLAIVASSHEELEQRLAEFVDDHRSTGVYTGQIKGSLWSKAASDPISPVGNDAVLFEEDSDAQTLLRIWCQKMQLEKIARVWVRGVNVDWMFLYTVWAEQASTLPYRISLPTYPFARQRYWVSASKFASPQTMLLTPNWKEQEAAPLPVGGMAPSTFLLVLLCGSTDLFASRIEAKLAPDQFASRSPIIDTPYHSGELASPSVQTRCHSLSSTQPRRELRFQNCVVQLIQELQYLLRSRPTGVTKEMEASPTVRERNVGAVPCADPIPTASFLVQLVVTHSEDVSLLDA
ncbi:MAG: hypothetical protein E6J34_18655, partial [Chloroflexi bacterium]